MQSLSIDVPILMYHQLSREASAGDYTIPLRQFTAQLDRVADAGFVTVGIHQLLQALTGVGRLPRRPLLITFDDGYDTFSELAVPALVARKMTATVFVVAGAIGGANQWDVGVATSGARLMNENAIREVVAAGMDIGSHGWAHRDLTACSAEEADQELTHSRRELQGRFGVAVQAFAYPYGRHTARLCNLVEGAGYRAALSIFSNAPTVTANRYAMRRIYPHAGDTDFTFRCKLSQGYLRYVAWRDRGRAPESFR